MNIPLDICEARRYLGLAPSDGSSDEVIQECYALLCHAVEPKVEHRIFAIDGAEPIVICGREFPGKGLLRHLSGCEQACIMAATLGAGVDRLIARYSRVGILKGAVLQATAAAMIETVCDAFCEELDKQVAPLYCTGRYSPGYGDLPLTTQKDVTELLDTPRRMGLTLTESCMLAPAKSVTAFVGISATPKPRCTRTCDMCNKTDCAFRRKQTRTP